MSASILSMLRCPHCVREKEGRLAREGADWLVCQEPGCGRRYPIVDGTPVMLTEEGDYFGYLQRRPNAKASEAKNGRD